ncbi:hypothetical protein psal_cds_636 [Pandoravirus salinus]|uniref:F-box incomplete domain containing protein n=1 Tax=Pandoravirus salinus TaxID=1349410 RepID=S4W265_9VIRU|nr:hypothetical protein psal_cds_636 [Pandoravirus salinus]AGO84527.1 hypothetical protein psal_cds_636 [Pandoravirus salinus]
MGLFLIEKKKSEKAKTDRRTDRKNKMQRRATIDDLPPELLRMVLNGSAPPKPRPPWQSGAPPRCGRPFFDPRWRFAARAVCRLWAEVIAHPSTSEAAAMGRHPHKRATVLHQRAPVACPKWPTGRVVCASAVADLIAGGCWSSADVDTIYRWCVATASATRKQVLAVMVASGERWAVRHALDAARTFGDVDTDLDMSRRAGEYDAWDNDARGDARGLLAVLCDVAIQRGCLSTVADLDAWYTRGVISAACRHGRVDLVNDRTVARWPPGGECWAAAAEAVDPCCFARLLDLAAGGHLDPMPPATLDDAAGWLRAAVVKGRWRLLALLDARGIAFDAAPVFALAAAASRTRLAQWLWARAQKGPPTPGQGPPLDARATIARALGSGLAKPHTTLDTVVWLCETCLGGGSFDDVVNGLFMAHLDRQVLMEVLLYAGRRWPGPFLATYGPRGVEEAFGFCVFNRSLHGLVSLMGILDACADRTGWTRPCDLWDALVTLCAKDCGHFAYTPMLAVMRLARATSLGLPPRAADVALLDGAYNREVATPCSCVGDPLWRHSDESHESAASKRRRVDSDTGPCEDVRLVGSLAPLARWCRPRPVALARVFPEWTPPLPKQMTGSTTSEIQLVARLKLDVVEWLDREGLLLVDE